MRETLVKDKSVSTIGMHMRNIRTLMNEAKKAGVSKESQYPFGKGLFEIKTGIGRKKGLTKKQLKVISDYKSGNKMTNRYKDFWIFIYLCNGINPTDMLKLKFSDIVDGEICFVRQKTERTTKTEKKYEQLFQYKRRLSLINGGTSLYLTIIYFHI